MNLANFTKSPNFICQTSYNSTTTVSILTFSPNFICQIDIFTFSPNFSPTKLLSYTVCNCCLPSVWCNLISVSVITMCK